MTARLRHPAVTALAGLFLLCGLVIVFDRTVAVEQPRDTVAADTGSSGAPVDDEAAPSRTAGLTAPGDWQVTPPSAPSAGAAPPADATSDPLAVAPDAPAEPAVAPAPRRLSVDDLGLSEDLIDLGIAPDGTMEVPRDPDRVGWFADGGRPGGPGPTVLVGHVDSVDGPAVFARLWELEVGDEVTVVTAEEQHRYRVSDVRNVPQDDFPTGEVFGATRVDTLRLITCSGPYDRDVGRYTENRVVTAVPA